MKKLIAVAFSIAFLCSAVAPAFAGGDKVRDDIGQGAVNQVDSNSRGNQNKI